MRASWESWGSVSCSAVSPDSKPRSPISRTRSPTTITIWMTAFQLRANAVIQIVIVVGDLVREIGDLGFESGLTALHETLPQLSQLARIAHRAVFQNAF